MTQRAQQGGLGVTLRQHALTPGQVEHLQRGGGTGFFQLSGQALGVVQQLLGQGIHPRHVLRLRGLLQGFAQALPGRGHLLDGGGQRRV